jgi:hypothetical protein
VPDVKPMPPRLGPWQMVDEVHELLYRDMCLFVVPLCVRGEGDVVACEGLSLLCGQILGSRVPGCEARDYTF